jgi:hypothetical protein
MKGEGNVSDDKVAKKYLCDELKRRADELWCLAVNMRKAGVTT